MILMFTANIIQTKNALRLQTKINMPLNLFKQQYLELAKYGPLGVI